MALDDQPKPLLLTLRLPLRLLTAAAAPLRSPQPDRPRQRCPALDAASLKLQLEPQSYPCPYAYRGVWGGRLAMLPSAHAQTYAAACSTPPLPPTTCRRPTTTHPSPSPAPAPPLQVEGRRPRRRTPSRFTPWPPQATARASRSRTSPPPGRAGRPTSRQPWRPRTTLATPATGMPQPMPPPLPWPAHWCTTASPSCAWCCPPRRSAGTRRWRQAGSCRARHHACLCLPTTRSSRHSRRAMLPARQGTAAASAGACRSGWLRAPAVPRPRSATALPLPLCGTPHPPQPPPFCCLPCSRVVQASGTDDASSPTSARSRDGTPRHGASPHSGARRAGLPGAELSWSAQRQCPRATWPSAALLSTGQPLYHCLQGEPASATPPAPTLPPPATLAAVARSTPPFHSRHLKVRAGRPCLRSANVSMRVSMQHCTAAVDPGLLSCSQQSLLPGGAASLPGGSRCKGSIAQFIRRLACRRSVDVACRRSQPQWLVWRLGVDGGRSPGSVASQPTRLPWRRSTGCLGPAHAIAAVKLQPDARYVHTWQQERVGIQGKVGGRCRSAPLGTSRRGEGGWLQAPSRDLPSFNLSPSDHHLVQDLGLVLLGRD